MSSSRLTVKRRSGLDKKRLLIVGAVPPPFGGVASLVLGLVESDVIAAEFQIDVLNTAKSPRDAFHVLTVPNLARTASHITQLAWRLALRRHQVVQVYCSHPISSFLKAVALAAVARGMGAKVVLDFHDPFFEEKYSGALAPARFLLRRSLRVPHAIRVASSQWWRELAPLMGGRSDDIVVIPNYVDVDAISVRTGPSDPAKVRVLFVGSLGERKGIYDLFQILPRMIEELPETIYDIYGNPETPQMERDVQAFVAGLRTDRIRFPGWIDYSELLKTYARYDLFLFPSHAENFPVCVLEAMAAGLPIITTPVGSLAEILVDGENALLVEPGNLEQIRTALRVLVGHEGMRSEMGQRNRALILAKYDRQVVHTQIRALYKRLISH
jgi:glycosyltransferase involved in cell wall biosynthesis